MKSLWAWFLGIGGRVWTVLGPWLRSETVTFITAPDVWKLATAAVESATKLDINGDGKYKSAAGDLQKGLNALGIKYREQLIRQAIEIAYDVAKQAGKLPPQKAPTPCRHRQATIDRPART